MSVPYQGDYAVGAEVTVWFNAFDSNDPSASVTVTNLVDTDIHIYKDDSLTQRANAAGTAVDIDVDTFVGVHKLTIDTADNTVNDFYEAGHDYAVVVEGITIDGAQVSACVATFSIANRRVAGQMCVSSIEALTDQSNFTLTAGEASANNDAYNGCTIIVTDQTTKIQKAVGHISGYVGATRAIVLHAAPLQTAFTMAVADSIEIFATAAFANVNTVGQTVQTANDNGADINTLITNVGSPANIDSGGATLSDNLKKIADDNSGATFDATTDSLNKIRDNELQSILAGTVTNAQGTDVAADVAAMIDGNNRVDVGSWLGQAVTLSTGNQPDVNVDRIDDVAVSTVATDGKLHVRNDAGGTIQAAADAALVANNLDHLMKIATSNSATLPEVVDNTILANIMTKTDGDTSDFDFTTDSLEAIRDKLTNIETDTAEIGSGVALDAGAATIAGMLTKIADDNGGATFDAGTDSLNKIRDDRTLPAADYVVVGDTIAGVTLATTCTTNTDLVTASAIRTEMETDAGDLSSLMEALVNKLQITEASGDAEMFNDASASQGTVSAAITSVAGVTKRERMFK